MIRLDIDGDLEKFESTLNTFKKRAGKFIVMNTINDTLFDLREKSVKQAVKQIDKPARFTLKGFRVKKAKVSSLSGSVYITPQVSKYLSKLILGGVHSKSDKPLVVPVNARLNKYGNIPGLRGGKKIDSLIQGKRTFGMSRRGFDGPPGIWRRVNRNKKLKTVILLQDRRVVKKQFYWYEMLNSSASKIFNRNMRRYIKKEIAYIETRNKAS